MANEIIITGKSIEELRENLRMLEKAVATGAKCGCGGTSLAEVRTGLDSVAPVPKKTVPQKTAPKKCDCCCIQDEKDDIEDILADLFDNLIQSIKNR